LGPKAGQNQGYVKQLNGNNIANNSQKRTQSTIQSSQNISINKGQF